MVTARPLAAQPQLLGDVLDQAGDVDLLQPLGLALETTEVEEVLDQRSQPYDVALHHPHHLRVLDVDLVTEVLVEQLEVPGDAGQRGTQLVGHVGRRTPT